MKKTQLQIYQEVRGRIARVCRTFNDIQCGPNPLTNDEIGKLIKKNPSLWGIFEGKGTDAPVGGQHENQ